MSNRYKGGVISATPPTTTGGESGTASGAWTLEQQMQLQAAGLWPSQPPPLFIEDVFSCFLYTGNGSTQTITNGIDLSTKGGLVWMKGRNSAINGVLCDTVRSRQYYLISDAIVVQQGPSTAGRDLSTFNSNGFSLGINENVNINSNGTTMVSWTFREQPKFFDVVTYNGTGADMAVNHNLQAQPGCVIIKRLNQNSDWNVMFPGLISDGYGGTGRMSLNKTDAYSATGWTSVANSTQITIPTNTHAINEVGGTYVAYLFASNAGGFGLSGTDNVISCGSVTADGSGNATVNLGYEPQWILIKSSSEANSWAIVDTMRGLPADGIDRFLFANSAAAESGGGLVNINATGFYANATLSASATYIYIAIRRGPMRVPTTGTSVYNSVAGAAGGITTGFVTDGGFVGQRSGSDKYYWSTRLTGTEYLNSVSGSAGTDFVSIVWDRMNGFWNNDLTSYQGWGFRRAPGFFDVVCYTGTGVARTVAHNLGVSPGIVIIKKRNAVMDWSGGYDINFDGSSYARLTLNTNSSDGGYNDAIISAVSSTTFSVGASTQVNASGDTYVAYLFATCAGVSKVGSYTGNGTSQTIPCGFTSGARFVLIKKSSGTGDWMVSDSARGIVAGSDPYLELNNTNAEVAGEDWLDTDSTGFVVNEVSGSNANTSGATYIFLAIA